MRIFSILITSILISGCFASTALYFPSGGSRADGIVDLVCSYDSFTRCETTTSHYMNVAAARVCKGWGYTGANPFGGYVNQAGLNYTGQVRISYQCTGDLEE